MTQFEQPVFPHHVDAQVKAPLNTKEQQQLIEELKQEVKHLREQNRALKEEIHRKK